MVQLCLVAAFLVAVASSMAHNLPTGMPFRGVNLAGAEYGLDEGGLGQLGTHGTNYWWPAPQYGFTGAGYFINKGMNLFRIPFRWERLQPVKGQPLNGAELKRLKATVQALRAYPGVTIYLDMHNYHRYLAPKGTGAERTNLVAVIDQGPHTKNAQFADGWARIATEFKDDMNVMFALMNEPHHLNMTQYFQSIQAAVTSIRATGAKNYLSMMGGDWGSASYYGVKTAEADQMLASVKDPNGKMLFEAHLYMDDAGGGSHLCNGVEIGRTKCSMFTDWLRKNQQVGFIGEFSVGYGTVCQQALDTLLKHMEYNSDVYAGWAYWGAGVPFQRGPSDNPMSLEPVNGGDREQMNTLEPHIKWKRGDPVTDLVRTPNGCPTGQYGQCNGNQSYLSSGGSTCCPTGFWCMYKEPNWSDCKIGSKPGSPVPTPVIAPVPPAPGSCSNVYFSPCGGQNFKGTKCCPSGSYCKVTDASWSDCQPGSSPCANKLTSQCDGKNFAGAKCCPSGMFCKVHDEWYSDCQVGTIPGPAPKPVPTGPMPTTPASESCATLPGKQCGGKDWAGPKCCPTGYTCTVHDQWWSGCQKSTISSPPPTSTPISTSRAVTSMILSDVGGTKVVIKDPLANGAVINLRDLSTGQVSIRAVTNPSTVPSVKFTTNFGVNSVDSSATFNTATTAPFTAAGSYYVTATPYSGTAGTGTPGTALTRTFSLVTVQVDANVMKIVSSLQASSATLGALGMKYTRYDLSKTWADASAYCVSKGGKLAMPKSSTDYATMKRYLPVARTNAWIGVQKVSGVLKFVDGTSVAATYWSSGEGGIANELCVGVLTSGVNEKNYGRWLDTSCSTARYFICQK